MQIVTDQYQKELKPHGNAGFPLLVSYERLSKYESGSFLWHWHPEIELTLIDRGEMLYKVDRSEFHLHAGNAIFSNVNALHAGFMCEQQDCQYISVTFDPKLIYGFHGSTVERSYVEPITQSTALSAVAFDGTQPWHSLAITAIQEIIRLDAEKPPLYELSIISALQTLWMQLYLNVPPKTAVSPRDKVEDNRIRRILAYIEEHYTQHLTLEEIAGEIHLCPSECSRLFKRRMNHSLFAFLQEYRVERSLELLADEQLSITEVSARAGFTDSNYYAKVFIKHKGCTPRAYRAKSKMR